MRRRAPQLAALAIAGALGSGTDLAHAQCADGAYESIALTSGIAVATGAAGSLGTAGIISATDDTRDFSFGLGAGVGIAVSAGLAGLYALVDSTTGCGMSNDSQPVVWSVPIVTFVVGAALPAALWGASDKLEGSAEQALAIRGHWDL